jgi:prepilin-type N-terminal cleavage/methylation domain-containing protein
MLTNPFTTKISGSSGRRGFTLVELLVAIGILAILAGVALGPIIHAIKQAQENATVQTAHQMGVLEFSYANDHGQIYPYGTTSEAIANLLLNGGYASNPDTFYVTGTAGAAKYTGTAAPYSLRKNNVNWDYVVNGAFATGLSDATCDLTPLCQLTGSIDLAPLPTTVGNGLTLTIDPAQAPFGSDGIAVVYKGGNAVFVRCHAVTPAKAINTPSSPVPWVGPQYADPKAANYALVEP